MNMQEQLRALVMRHHASLPEQIGSVARLLDAGAGHVSNARIVEAERIMHQLKGTAGSMGFPAINAAATILDEKLKALKWRNAAVPAVELNETLGLLDSLRRIVEATPPQMSSLYDVDLSQLARHG
jgi:HPt (histidine-containing phosphotransfer) domain-containing protein